MIRTFTSDAESADEGKLVRCAIYAHFSAHKQDVQSFETQPMMCRREIARKGWQEVACFTESAKSAATVHRPG